MGLPDDHPGAHRSWNSPDTPLTELGFVGPKLADRLAARGYECVGDVRLADPHGTNSWR
jgi:hypothetical protein